MTAATVTLRLDVNNPSEEVVLLTTSDGYTYVSQKFGAVTAVQATLMEDTTTLTYPVSIAISGGTITTHCEGLSGKQVLVTLYGDK